LPSDRGGRKNQDQEEQENLPVTQTIHRSHSGPA
jgi:hypothetical protein